MLITSEMAQWWICEAEAVCLWWNWIPFRGEQTDKLCSDRLYT